MDAQPVRLLTVGHGTLDAEAAVLLAAVPVQHLFHDGRLQDHPPTPAARRVDRTLVYDRGVDRSLLPRDGRA